MKYYIDEKTNHIFAYDTDEDAKVFNENYDDLVEITIEKAQEITNPPLSLDESKALKKDAINEARTNAELAGFWFNDKEFDSDRDSISRIGNAATAAQSALLMKKEFAVNWITKDNSIIQLDANGVLMMHNALVQHVDVANAKSQLLKKRVDAANNINEVEAITWESE